MKQLFYVKKKDFFPSSLNMNIFTVLCLAARSIELGRRFTGVHVGATFSLLYTGSPAFRHEEIAQQVINAFAGQDYHINKMFPGFDLKVPITSVPHLINVLVEQLIEGELLPEDQTTSVRKVQVRVVEKEGDSPFEYPGAAPPLSYMKLGLRLGFRLASTVHCDGGFGAEDPSTGLRCRGLG